MLEAKIEQDLKAALLGGDKQRVTTLRGLKAVLLNAKITAGKRDSGLNDEDVQSLLAKQVKQRQESADMYVQGGDQERADAELAEKAIIEAYLPAQLDEAAIRKLIDEVITQTGTIGQSAMGQVIGQVKGRAGATADGAVIARLVKEELQ
jgi:uncharacterized protein YqeY